ncbi:DegT/DnrJ/EryC1/StrS family aminotransferase [Kosmotoga pacifica]|uniref:Polysaccharide biosynthesis protein n=1 Tax=Kosmotoga pacifica TaxID=1330330 RepID=A0A0G2ZF99_9BACT|nr:DegT/DnrJ/EryC1/StrS family aminotransferase [Kosmotoga pacifica]AKI97443.1 polysaccharide biosynthesis protein [Kosmotoga pacifica]
MFVPLSKPFITDDEIATTIEVLKSGVLSIGEKVKAFEMAIATFVGSKYAVAVNSGTSALHLILKALGFSRQQKLLSSAFTFISSANVALYEGGIPIFADIDKNTLNISPETLQEAIEKYSRKGLRTNTINLKPFIPEFLMGVDIFGHPMDWDGIMEICNRFNIKVVEDSCEALGSEYKGKKAGTFGQAGAFAFYPNKQITTGEGGVIVTDDSELAKLTRSMRNQGRGEAEEWLEHVRIGYNYRLDELSAAIGLEQMKKIEEILSKRSTAATYYTSLFEKIDGIEPPHIEGYSTKIGWFVYVVRLAPSVDREKVMDYLKENGIQSRDYFKPVHLQPFYRKTFGYSEGFLPVTEEISKRTLAIPFYTSITREEQEYVVYHLSKAVESFGG